MGDNHLLEIRLLETGFLSRFQIFFFFFCFIFDLVRFGQVKLG